MILQALYSYYHALAQKGEISKEGWCVAKVSFALVLDENGALLDIMPLKVSKEFGKKTVDVPREMNLPNQFKRSGSKAPPYFLCDNTQYILGLEKGEVTEKSLRCFKAFSEYHIQMLSPLQCPEAQAIVRFLRSWQPTEALKHPVIIANQPHLLEGGNFVFRLSETSSYAQDVPEIQECWNAQESDASKAVQGVCLVTGKRAAIARIHNSVKGIRTTSLSPNGWTLVGMDKEAFESYGKTQSYNAPVCETAAFAYTTALSHLLSNRDHVRLLGDATVVYWAENAEPMYQNVFDMELDASAKFSQDDLLRVMDAFSRGSSCDMDGVELSPETKFYILGLSPNSARLSVRFFYQNTFHNLLINIEDHYRRLDIVRPSYEKFERLSISALLDETVNQKAKDKSASPLLAGALLLAVLQNTPYPAALYNSVMLRIRAEQKVTRGRAAIIKAVLFKKINISNEIKEVLIVKLNEQSTYVPYVLGRVFSLLESIQQAANPGLNSTIKDRYFNSACATPSVVFPLLLRLKNSHIRVLKREKSGLAIHYEKQLGSLMSGIEQTFPSHLNLDEQGTFILGYYHQTQKQYEKQNKED